MTFALEVNNYIIYLFHKWKIILKLWEVFLIFFLSLGGILFWLTLYNISLGSDSRHLSVVFWILSESGYGYALLCKIHALFPSQSNTKLRSTADSKHCQSNTKLRSTTDSKHCQSNTTLSTADSKHCQSNTKLRSTADSKHCQSSTKLLSTADSKHCQSIKVLSTADSKHCQSNIKVLSTADSKHLQSNIKDSQHKIISPNTVVFLIFAETNQLWNS